MYYVHTYFGLVDLLGYSMNKINVLLSLSAHCSFLCEFFALIKEKKALYEHVCKYYESADPDVRSNSSGKFVN